MSGKYPAAHILKLQPIRGVKMSDEGNFEVKTCARDDECLAKRPRSNSEDDQYECANQTVPEPDVSSNFVCDLCGKQFKHMENLQNHLVCRSQKQTVQIGRCLQRRDCKIASSDSDPASITAENCDVEFENGNSQKWYSVEQSREDAALPEESVLPVRCISSGRTFKSVEGHKSHPCSNLDQQQNDINQHSNGEQVVGASNTQVAVPVECNSCKRTFKSKTGLQRHRCRDLDKQPFICDYCGQVFHRRQNFERHENIHTRKIAYVCDVCNQTFSHLSTLHRHRYSVHAGERSHKCEVCGKCFAQKTALKVHVRIHTGDLPYECDVCHRRFNIKGNLTQHSYVHTGEYPFPCDVCKKGFRKKRKLLDHYAIHTDPAKEAAYMEKLNRNREIVCDVCGKKLPKQSELIRHYRTHTGERPYKCEECGMGFTRKHTLIGHSYTHTKEYPFICLMCYKGYPFYSELKKHFKKVHPKHSRP